MSVCICTVECLKWVTEVVEIVNSVFGRPSSILYNVSVCVYAHVCDVCVFTVYMSIDGAHPGPKTNSDNLGRYCP